MIIEVQPPSQATVGATLYPPLVVSSDSDAQISYLDVEATDDHGQAYSVLSGVTSKSRTPLDDNNPSSSSNARVSEYAAFPDLSITYPGTYILRVNAVLMDYTNLILDSVKPLWVKIEIQEAMVDVRIIAVADRKHSGRFPGSSAFARSSRRRSVVASNGMLYEKIRLR